MKKEATAATPVGGAAAAGDRLSASAAGLGRPAAASPQRRKATDAQRRLRPERLDVSLLASYR
jgi:hypothetical protein